MHANPGKAIGTRAKSNFSSGRRWAGREARRPSAIPGRVTKN